MQIEWTREDGSPQSMTIPSEGLTIGRNARYDIYLPDAEVSGSKPHAQIVLKGDDFYIIDCASKNGTKLDDRSLAPDMPMLLMPHAVITIGKYQLKCVATEEEDIRDPRHAHAERGGQELPPEPDPFVHKPRTPDNGQAGFQVPIRKEAPPKKIDYNSEDSIAIDLSQGAIRVGRATDNDIILDDAAVSGHHAEIVPSAGGYTVRDLNSKNGTFVNEKRITQPTVIKAEDRVRIGRNRFKLPETKPSENNASLPMREHVARLKPVSDGRHIRLDAYNLRREVESGEGHLVLLENVSVTIQGGEMVALIGGSGAGKTTLMLALNGYVKANRGEVLLNGVDFYQNSEMFSTAMGYVPQQDIVHGDLPVGSALRYAAELRLPPDTNAAEIDALVDKVLNQLSMGHRKNNLISTLSGGQRKRVNIGVELLTRPSILFLDEPTTGLDAGTEKKVTKLMRELAEGGCTIITVTHAVQTLQYYDKVIVMAPGGKLVYYGPLGKEDLKREFGLDDYADLYDNLERRNTINASQPRPRVNSTPGTVRTRQSSWTQFTALVRRYAEILSNDKRNLYQLLAQTPVVGLFICLLFHREAFDPIDKLTSSSPPQEPAHVVLLLALAMVCFCLLNSYREIIKEMAIYMRERHVSLRIWPYIFSKLVILTIIALVQILLFLFVVNLKITLNLSMSELQHLVVLLLIGAVNATLLGLLVSALSKSSDQATTTAGLLLLAQVIFSGFIPMSDAVKPIADICAMHWMYGGIGNLFQISDRLDKLRGLGIQVPKQPVFDMSFGTAVQHLGVLAVVTLCLVWLALWLPEEMAARKGQA